MHKALTGFARLVRPGSTTIVLVLLAAALAMPATAQANSKYAGLVMDAKTGKVLYQSHADSPRYPASLTKMMTLYLVFEALQSRRISTSTHIPFSRNAASEPPTKLGVPAGKSISVQQAIQALVTRSANDVSTAVAEFLGGSETNFAKMMTAKARQLGMSRTTFKNAHGLPNSGQTTTARDMARLGIALREHFPQYYDYFSTRSFTYAGRRITTHNRLLGRVKGVDGIKTGYTRASGYNLVTSVEANGRSIVAVVMGGKSGRSRDAHMADLINRYLNKGSRGRDRDLIARGTISATQPVAVASALPRTNVPVPTDRPEVVAVAAYAGSEPASSAIEPPNPIRPDADLDPVSTASTARGGWVIQVGSMPTEDEARAILARTAQTAPTVLAQADAFTETFVKDGRTYHRARFAGFSSKTAAWNACASLKKKSVACYAVQQ